MKMKENTKLQMTPKMHKYYINWINSPTLLNDYADIERFYRFAKSCIYGIRKKRTGEWLRIYLEKDLKEKYEENYLREKINEIVSIFDHIMNFTYTQFPKHLIEMSNPILVKCELENLETNDGKKCYSPKQIKNILSKNFGNDWEKQLRNNLYSRKKVK